MAKANKTAAQAITSQLKKSKKGQTAQTIAEKTGLNLNTVRFTLAQLVADKTASIKDTEQTGSRGRPANIYLAN